MRTILTAALPLLLVGCVLPPAMVITSSAGDSASYAETGKSMADYALSYVVDRDCTVMHGLSRGKFCRDEPESLLAQIPDQADGAAVEPTDEKAEAPVFATADELSTWTGGRQSGPRPDSAKLSPAPEPLWALILGVFSNYEQANELAAKLKPGPAVVSSVVVRGAVFYRVTTRPFKMDEAAANEKQVSEIGLPDAKVVPVCPRWMQDDTCLVVDGLRP